MSVLPPATGEPQDPVGSPVSQMSQRPPPSPSFGPAVPNPSQQMFLSSAPATPVVPLHPGSASLWQSQQNAMYADAQFELEGINAAQWTEEVTANFPTHWEIDGEEVDDQRDSLRASLAWQKGRDVCVSSSERPVNIIACASWITCRQTQARQTGLT